MKRISYIKALLVMVTGVFALIGAAIAAPTVGFDQVDNSTFPVGTSVAVTGNAGGTVGTLDLAIVMDASGSMGASVGGGQTRADIQREAAIALVNSLPAGTRVSIVQFTGSATVLQSLVALDSQANIDLVIAAITSVTPGGGTNIGNGIIAATNEFNANGDANNSQRIILISDGQSNQTAAVNAATAAIAAGVEEITTVGLTGTDVALMTAVATAGNGQFIDVTGNPQALAGIFTGQGGNLVNIASASVTLPDGTVLALTVDGLGNFTIPAWVIALGDNMFSVTAIDTNGDSTTALLNLIGTTQPTSDVPLPAAAWFMGAGLAAYGARRKRKVAA